MTIVYDDGSVQHTGTIDVEKFRKTATDGYDWLTKLTKLSGDERSVVALIPCPITPGYQRLQRKESMT